MEVVSEVNTPGKVIESRIVLMSYTGGLLGIFSEPHKELELILRQNNAQGFHLIQVLPGNPGVGAVLVQLFFLCITFTIWAPIPGEKLIFERVS